MVNAVPNINVGKQRSHVIYRIVAAAVLFTIGAPVLALLFGIATVAGVLLLLVDAFLGLVRDERWAGGMLQDWAMRLFSWPFDIVWWIFSGQTTSGDAAFPWIP